MRKFLGGLAIFAVSAATLGAQVQPWNLPYVRPAGYNYSNLYSTDLKNFIAGNPNFFKTELQQAWTYWKANFMMADGLVNHKRLENNNQIGANEAVSEGQGYGMLLAVLLNDQPTFNKIFEAANAKMWDGGKKSYRWTWPSGSAGAATDADLDIGLALVFADELRKGNMWQAYNQGGVTYNSRAMEVIRSLKNTMTSQNYLLPGDSWGGDGINNLNPSYFATAWLRVFNAYQSEVDFTAVIASCYSVLEKMPRYNFGQAPDWCNPNGGQASQAGGKPEQGLGMLSDGIRTPWRIGLDALWFKDPKAIAYCLKTKATLTETAFAPLASQMAHYNKNGTPVTATQGSFDNMTMWLTAVLGSGETAYTQRAVTSEMMNRIIGGSLSQTYLGALSLGDDKFYYKQSIGMLGLAAIGGQFPNLFADTKVPVGILVPLEKSRSGAFAQRLFPGSSPSWLTPGATSDSWRDALGRTALPLP